MKTKEEIEAVIRDIQAVCEKHGIVLYGSCSSEGIYSEITIAESLPDMVKECCSETPKLEEYFDHYNGKVCYGDWYLEYITGQYKEV